MLNMDFAQRVVIDSHAQDWQPSPMAGVMRKPLAREDAERGHATSIVKYEPGARFSEHPHPFTKVSHMQPQEASEHHHGGTAKAAP